MGKAMPRNVRNFWIEAQIDGRNTTLSGGPISRDGGINVTIYQRSNGSVTTAAYLRGYARADGTLTLWIEDVVTGQRIEHQTHRDLPAASVTQ